MVKYLVVFAEVAVPYCMVVVPLVKVVEAVVPVAWGVTCRMLVGQEGIVAVRYLVEIAVGNAHSTMNFLAIEVCKTKE